MDQKDEVLQSFALVRTAMKRTRAEVNVFRLEVFAQLVQRTHDKDAANRFFCAPHGAVRTTAAAGSDPGARGSPTN
jgi:hypothetical protein